MLCKTNPDQDGIFGNTYCGVPNPQVPHLHPYPTRYHGMVGTVPQSYLPYRVRPYAKDPYVSKAPPLAPWEKRGMGAVQDANFGLMAHTLVGGVIGAAVAPQRDQRWRWAAAGAAIHLIAGTAHSASLGNTGIGLLAAAALASKR